MRLPALTLLVALAAPPVVAQTITEPHFANAAQYSRTHGGLALYVEQGGRLVAESYAPGYSASTPHKIYSGTKSFVAIGALIAEQEGLLTLDEKASDTLPEWRNDARRSITIAQLLSHTSGLDNDSELIDPYRDQMAAAVRVHLIDPPGTRFHYGAVNYQAFGEILRRKLRAKDESVEDFLKDKVFDPLDIDIDGWVRDNAGKLAHPQRPFPHPRAMGQVRRIHQPRPRRRAQPNHLQCRPGAAPHRPPCQPRLWPGILAEPAAARPAPPIHR